MFKAKTYMIVFILILSCANLLFGVAVQGIQFSISGNDKFVENNDTHTFTVTKSGNIATAGTVDFSFSGNADYGQDYINIGGTSGATTTSGTIAFDSGESSKTITLTTVDDLLDEPLLELITVKLSNPTAAEGIASLARFKKTSIKTIIDNDPQPKVTLSLQGSPFKENGGVATVTATLSCVSGRDVLITLRFSGTASKSDYTKSSRFIRINAGSTQGSITLTGVDDTEDDDNETVIVNILLSVNADELGKQTVIAVIANEAPYLSRIPDLVLLEDQRSSKIEFIINDEDDPISALRVFGCAENRTLIPDANFTFYGDGKERAFRVKPAPNQHGKTRAWIQVFDGTNWISQPFYITVKEQNDPPGPGEEPEPVVFNEDDSDSLFLSTYVNDPDDDPSDLRWIVTVIQQTGQNNGLAKIQLQSLKSLYKSCYVIFDPAVPVSSVLKDTSQTDTWVIIPEDAPLVSTAEFDTLHISSLDQVNGLYVSIVRATTETFFYGSPNFYDSLIPLLFTARDPCNATFSFTLDVTINPINDPPVFQEPLPNIELMAGVTKQADWGLYSFIDDIDNENSELELQAFDSEHITVVLKSDSLVLTAAPDWAGTENVKVWVSDGDAADSAYCEITVTAAGNMQLMSLTTDVETITEVPTEYQLQSNYPNPFNPTTTIAYDIPEYTHVTISVYNAMGQFVQNLINENKEPGFHTFEWNASEFSSGLYFIKMHTYHYQFMRRCILLK